MNNLKELYSKNVNIMKYFRENDEDNKNTNSLDAILVSYDYQAGSYTGHYNSEDIVTDTYVCNGEIVDMRAQDYTKLAAKSLAEIFDNLDAESILEIGMGEATTICDIVLDLPPDKLKWVGGIELSLSRLLWAKEFEKQKGAVNINQAVGDMFCLPFENNSVDIVFTYYCIDAHRGKEKYAIQEMLRVADKYLVLIEPTYELGNEATKKRIDEMCYIKNLLGTLKDMDLEVVEHRLFDVYTYNNNAALTIIKKKDDLHKKLKSDVVEYACPVCKNKIIKYKDNFWCKECFKIYPVIDDIPVLLRDKAILCSKYMDF